MAVSVLNTFRLVRAECLGDGYDVSDLLYYDINTCYRTLPTQCLEQLVFTPTVKDVLAKYMDGMMSALLNLHRLFEDLTQHAAQHVQSMTTYQRVLWRKSRQLWPEWIRPI